MVDIRKFTRELTELEGALLKAKRVLITAPGAADGDSVGAQLALKQMLGERYPSLAVRIINDEPLPPRYLFMPGVKEILTPETFSLLKEPLSFDVGFIVDGGVDRAGRLEKVFAACPVTVFVDHHVVSCDFPYRIKLVEPTACSTTELIYHIAQSSFFRTEASKDFCQQIYLGLIFDTGFFRHSNTTPEALELGAKLLRSGFDFTRVGERGMLERSMSSLKLLSNTLSNAEFRAEGKIIFSTLSQADLKTFHADNDDREGIIDHLFLIHGIDVALLFFELPENKTKVSLRSQGWIDVAAFARSLTEHGGGHQKAAGANLDMGLEEAVHWTLSRLEELIKQGPLKVARG